MIATNQGEPLVGKNSLAGQAFYNVCMRIEGKEVPFMDFPVLEICISILAVSIFMYLEITSAISFLINSIISGEQLTLSDISWL